MAEMRKERETVAAKPLKKMKLESSSSEELDGACSSPLIGRKVSTSTLVTNRYEGELLMEMQIKEICEKYSCRRKIEGDGNCFYRSFLFAYLERILNSNNYLEANRISDRILECEKTLRDSGFQNFIYEDYVTEFFDILGSVLGGNTASAMSTLLEKCCDPDTSDYGVMFLRFVTSGEIRQNYEFYRESILGYCGDVDQFCDHYVELMGVEANDVQIRALCIALGVPLRVVYLRSPTSTAPVNHLEFRDFHATHVFESSKSIASEPFISMLYRAGGSGHYEILYHRV